MGFDIKLVNGRLPGFTSLWNTLESPLFSPNKLSDCMGYGPCETGRTATAFYLEALCLQTGLSIHNFEPIRVILPTGEKPMFKKIKEISSKVIDVSGEQFELIIKNDLTAVRVRKSLADEIANERSIIFKNHDAAIVANVTGIRSSILLDDYCFILFEIINEHKD